MKRVKKYMEVFIIMGSLFGILLLLPFILKFGLWKGFIGTLIGTILWTAIMGATFIPIDFLLTRKLPSDASSVRQERVLQVQGEFIRIFEKSFEILRGMKFIKKIEPAEGSQSISARTKASIASFGEDLTLEFKPMDGENTEVYISSCPIVRYTLLDFGKNYRNVERISKAITGAITSTTSD